MRQLIDSYFWSINSNKLTIQKEVYSTQTMFVEGKASALVTLKKKCCFETEHFFPIRTNWSLDRQYFLKFKGTF